MNAPTQTPMTAPIGGPEREEPEMGAALSDEAELVGSALDVVVGTTVAEFVITMVAEPGTRAWETDSASEAETWSVSKSRPVAVPAAAVTVAAPALTPATPVGMANGASTGARL